MRTEAKPESVSRKPDLVRVLKINSSSRAQASVTRALVHRVVEHLGQKARKLDVKERDLASIPPPFIDEAWVEASYTAADQRSDQQKQILSLSDQLIKELRDADVIVIGAPVYNFSIPAALKAWIDQVARAGVTFRYTKNGPVGLLEGKKAYVVIATGGVPVGGEADFASGYLRHVLGFIGVHDVEIIAAERLNIDNEIGLKKAQRQIQQKVSVTGISSADHAA